MKYFVTERSFDEIDSATARAKARDDAESIVKELGYMTDLHTASSARSGGSSGSSLCG